MVTGDIIPTVTSMTGDMSVPTVTMLHWHDFGRMTDCTNWHWNVHALQWGWVCRWWAWRNIMQVENDEKLSAILKIACRWALMYSSASIIEIPPMNLFSMDSNSASYYYSQVMSSVVNGWTFCMESVVPVLTMYQLWCIYSEQTMIELVSSIHPSRVLLL